LCESVHDGRDVPVYDTPEDNTDTSFPFCVVTTIIV
jgi:hypothetical protein